ncbi:S49 family peptidase [Mucilaginibacter sp. BJC16-A38]|uniref:S49 family peptidase n=1 Tax=Mucilaginibacter phenanthrenivorans TaxID=1234842 RepID=UPI002157F6B3|nr:S49 family peptidase [Mucilaginibacter phenanthrenivorans]MCR8559608.1 S49 family peptidase [Mucilaginibacter phenanthrenivorans]
MSHTFHIPVLGLGYSIDTPLKVSRYGISSVLSIVDDELIERMREYHSEKNNEIYNAISKSEVDSRARRITAYLNLLARAVNRQFESLKAELFEAGSDLCRYFELLPEKSLLRQGYDLMMEYPDKERKTIFQNILRQHMTKGSIDVNIMSKVDKMNFTAEGEYTGSENTDALAALRGFAESDLESAIILSAGMNPRLYSYIESFNDFFPDKTGKLRKRIILKVSDFRSALIQAKFLAKKGLWVSEFRVESGLNCGGHAFATDGFLLGPILEEFKEKRQEMVDELYSLYLGALINKNIACDRVPEQRLSVQGGIGTAMESNFLMEYYHLDATGWGSPFLLVPEVTNVDEETLMQLAGAKEEDFYLSGASPLGILFNNFKPASMEKQRNERIENDRPGSPCTKKYLCTNTEFTEKPICTSSREYQNLKIKQLQALSLPEDEYQEQFDTITEKICLCEGLCSSAYLKYNINKPKENTAVSICPGPNMAYFSRIYSLEEMVSHIYGRLDLLENIKRPHVFIKELNLYIDYLQADLEKHIKDLNDKKRKHLDKFKAQLQNGIAYYKQLFSEWPELIASERKLNSINI